MSDSSIKTVFKNIAPAVVVMVAGLLGAFMVYDSYFSGDNTAAYSQISPAAGEEAAATDEGTAMDAAAEGAEVVYESAADAAGDAAAAVEEGAEDAAAAVEEKTEEMKDDATTEDATEEKTAE
jgi:hypothetical protein